MKYFKYKAMGIDGTLLKGEAKAYSRQEMLSYLHSDGYEAIYCKEVKLRNHGKTGIDDLKSFFLSLEFMQKAGIGIEQALDDMAKERGKLQNVAYDLCKEVSEGKSLSDAMESHPRIFDKIIIAKIKLGEETGDLVSSFREIKSYLEWMGELKSRIKKATRYPIIMGTVVLLAISVLILYLVPEVASFTRSMGQEVPVATTILMGISDNLRQNLYMIFVISVAFLGLIVMAYKISRSFRDFLINSLSRIPIISDCMKHLIISRYVKALGSLADGGANLIEAMKVAENTCHIQRFSKKLSFVSIRVKEGKSLSQSLSETGLFNWSAIQIVAIGEKTGNLDETLEHLHDFYHEKVVKSFDKMTAYLEPFLVIMAGIFLLLTVYAVFVPLYNSITELDLL